jgi:hypothetical protein
LCSCIITTWATWHHQLAPPPNTQPPTMSNHSSSVQQTLPCHRSSRDNLETHRLGARTESDSEMSLLELQHRARMTPSYASLSPSSSTIKFPGTRQARAEALVAVIDSALAILDDEDLIYSEMDLRGSLFHGGDTSTNSTSLQQ